MTRRFRRWCCKRQRQTTPLFRKKSACTQRGATFQTTTTPAGTRGKEAPEQFEVRDTNTLRQLDNADRMIISQQNYELKRKANIDPINDKFRMSGEFLFLADAGVFTECLTGVSFPVTQERDNSSL